jgi:hypothetical protein
MAAHLNSWSNFSVEQVSLLIQLRYELTRSDNNIVDVRKILLQLGFDESVAEEIFSDNSLKYYVIAQLTQQLDSLGDVYEEKYGIFESDLHPADIKEELESGTLSLHSSLLLTNPFSILKLEKIFKLPETGDKDLMIANWNKEYYSAQRCQEFNDPKTCMMKALEYNDTTNFMRLYSQFPINKDNKRVSIVPTMLSSIL